MFNLVAAPNARLSINFLSDLDSDRLAEIETLTDWAQTKAETARLDELGESEATPEGQLLVFRLDDVRDTGYRSGITAFLEMALQKKLKVTLGIIAGDFGTEPLLSLVREGAQRRYFQVAIHGWLHENFTSLGRPFRMKLLRKARRADDFSRRGHVTLDGFAELQQRNVKPGASF